MTKEQLQDALTWMQEIQARIAFNGIIDTEIDMSWHPTTNRYSLNFDFYLREKSDWTFFSIKSDYNEEAVTKTKDRILAYLEQFGIKPYAA